MYTVFLGAPGAGKGTQAAVLAQKLGLAHVASGDLFREAIEKETELGKQAKVYVVKGELVPDELTTKMILERLAAPDCTLGAILDGFPRTLSQAQSLDNALAQHDKTIEKVIYIKVQQEELQKRLSGRWICRNCQTPYHLVNSPPKVKGKCDKCGGELYQRADDTAEAVENRLKVYFAETAPLIDYYTKAGRLVEIDGQGDIAEVQERIAGIFGKEPAVRIN